MKIAVLVKQTPDTAELPRISPEQVDKGEVKATMAINPWDEYAVEESVRLSERFNSKSIAISMGVTSATDALRHALAMGIDAATLVDSSGIAVDIFATSAILASAIQSVGDVDLIVTGLQSVDAGTGSVFVGVSCKLGYPLISNVTKVIDIADGQITVERVRADARETVTTSLPAVISVSKAINEPRYPSFIGIRNANRTEIPIIAAGSLYEGEITKKTTWTQVRRSESASRECQIIEGTTAQEQAAQLVDSLLGEKVV